MTIEITRPEVEELIEQRLLAGGFATTEEMIFQALRGLDNRSRAKAKRRSRWHVYQSLSPSTELTLCRSGA